MPPAPPATVKQCRDCHGSHATLLCPRRRMHFQETSHRHDVASEMEREFQHLAGYYTDCVEGLHGGVWQVGARVRISEQATVARINLESEGEEDDDTDDGAASRSGSSLRRRRSSSSSFGSSGGGGGGGGGGGNGYVLLREGRQARESAESFRYWRKASALLDMWMLLLSPKGKKGGGGGGEEDEEEEEGCGSEGPCSPCSPVSPAKLSFDDALSPRARLSFIAEYRQHNKQAAARAAGGPVHSP